MKFLQAVTAIRRRLGFVLPTEESDIQWLCSRIVEENKEVFDRLAKS